MNNQIESGNITDTTLMIPITWSKCKQKWTNYVLITKKGFDQGCKMNLRGIILEKVVPRKVKN